MINVKFFEMNKQEELKRIIAKYNSLTYNQIDLGRKIENNYIASGFKYNFCNDIVQKWRDIDATALRNQMFNSLKTGNDILEFLN